MRTIREKSSLIVVGICMIVFSFTVLYILRFIESVIDSFVAFFVVVILLFCGVIIIKEGINGS